MLLSKALRILSAIILTSGPSDINDVGKYMYSYILE